MGAARAPGASRAANQAPEITDAGLIVRELCGKNVALLGESPLHGFAASALSPKLHSQSPTKATSAGEYFADLIVEDVLVVELKCVDRFSSEHTAQCLNSLRVSGLRQHFQGHSGRITHYPEVGQTWIEPP